MCGIAGIFDRSGTPPERTLLVRMTEALAHRGPDGEGYFVHEAAALGHRRLSIIDVEGGAQPMGNEDGSIQVVFNGEIYNFVELREELVELGHAFRTRSDTEVIVHAYEQWGERLVHRLERHVRVRRLRRDEAPDAARPRPPRHQAALLLDDRQPARIRLGDQGAPQAPALAARNGPRRARASCSPSATCLRPSRSSARCSSSPPGHLMRVSRDGIEVERYWNQVPRPLEARPVEALIEEYQELFEDAVRLQLRSDVPLGLFLSSGVDSGALMAVMSQHSSRPVEAFTIDFENGEATNESTDAARVAQRFGARPPLPDP